MGFLHVESLSGVMRVDADMDLWLYLAITLPLMLVTMLICYLWSLKVRRTVSKDMGDLEQGGKTKES